MELIYFGNGATNFGDDLNLIVWKHILPSWVFEVEDVAMFGIGTIFTDQWADSPKIYRKKVFVLGSGAGYAPLPRGLKSWTILALRGPLSAALIGEPQLAATDAAALLAVIPAMATSRQERDLILLMPNHGSIPGAYWQQVAETAGVTFVDPRWSPEVVMKYFSRAKLVLAEAMHGAIVADTLRIPWIPWAASPHHLPFKWMDWTMSLNLSYCPSVLPPTSTWEKWRHSIAKVNSRRRGVRTALHTTVLKEPSAYIDDFHARYGEREVPKSRTRKLIDSSLRTAVINVSRLFDRGEIEPAAEAVSRLMQQKSYLSKDEVLQSRVEQLQEAANRFVRILK